MCVRERERERERESKRDIRGGSERHTSRGRGADAHGHLVPEVKVQGLRSGLKFRVLG